MRLKNKGTVRNGLGIDVGRFREKANRILKKM